MSSSSERHLFSFFLDHAGRYALSLTYPIPINIVERFDDGRRLAPGEVEHYLRYPSFLIYTTEHDSFLHNATGQQRAKLALLKIVAELHVNEFFEVFQGVRFELYDGRPEFGQDLASGRPNLRFALAVGNHAKAEQEHRNIREIFKDDVNRYFSVLGQIRASSSADMDPADHLYQQQYLIDCLESICRTGGLVSEEFERFNIWRRTDHRIVERQQRQKQRPRRKTGSDLDLSREPPSFGFHRHRSCPVVSLPSTHPVPGKLRRRTKSVGELVQPVLLAIQERRSAHVKVWRPLLRSPDDYFIAVPTRAWYIRARVQRLIKQTLQNFYAPIIPKSFCSPPYHLWHSMVLVLPTMNVGKGGLYIMDFTKEPSLANMDCLEYFNPDRLERAVSHVSVSADHLVDSFAGTGRKRAKHVAYVLGQRLSSLGLMRPSMKPFHVPLNMKTATDLSVWFPECFGDQ